MSTRHVTCLKVLEKLAEAGQPAQTLTEDVGRAVGEGLTHPWRVGAKDFLASTLNTGPRAEWVDNPQDLVKAWQQASGYVKARKALGTTADALNTNKGAIAETATKMLPSYATPFAPQIHRAVGSAEDKLRSYVNALDTAARNAMSPLTAALAGRSASVAAEAAGKAGLQVGLGAAGQRLAGTAGEMITGTAEGLGPAAAIAMSGGRTVADITGLGSGGRGLGAGYTNTANIQQAYSNLWNATDANGNPLWKSIDPSLRPAMAKATLVELLKTPTKTLANAVRGVGTLPAGRQPYSNETPIGWLKNLGQNLYYRTGVSQALQYTNPLEIAADVAKGTGAAAGEAIKTAWNPQWREQLAARQAAVAQTAADEERINRQADTAYAARGMSPEGQARQSQADAELAQMNAMTAEIERERGGAGTGRTITPEEQAGLRRDESALDALAKRTKAIGQRTDAARERLADETWQHR